MAAASTQAPLVLVCGNDEFAVKHRAKDLFKQWSAELGGMDHEIIDATVSNSGDALRALGKLREALQTLPFFGGAKAVWLQDCTFLGDERAASAKAVTESLNDLAAELKTFPWDNVRLLISAGKVDKRKSFYKTIDKLGMVESFAGWSAEDRDWTGQAEMWARRKLREDSREISDEALAVLVVNVGPNARLLSSEVEKLLLYCGERKQIALGDVEAIVTRSKQARAFALGDALGDRDLPRALRCLDEELWEMKFDSQKSEIGLLYGLISKVRVLLMLKEMVARGMLKPEADYNRFKGQLERVPVDAFPTDRRFSPLALNPYVLFRALPQTRRYTQDELIAAMEMMLQCNLQLVSSGSEGAMVLQRALVEVIRVPPAAGKSQGRGS